MHDPEVAVVVERRVLTLSSALAPVRSNSRTPPSGAT
jgi:hypothetical protein